VQRRLGREALERLAEPLMAGIHNAECERQSLLATFPRFRAIEQRHGSLIRGMLALRGGVGTLAEALTARFGGRLIGGQGVSALWRDPCSSGRFVLALDDGSQLAADAVILTTPAYTAAATPRATTPRLR
jgi:oxygen-dependent protoporphyrinogen oxidase